MFRFRTHRPSVFIVSALLLTIPVACGGDDASSETTNDETEVADAEAATAEIVISGFAFSGPGTVEVGTTVVVRNDDDARHTWTSVDDVFDSGELTAGDSFSFTFDEPGEYAYFCEFHPSMAGTIVVTE